MYAHQGWLKEADPARHYLNGRGFIGKTEIHEPTETGVDEGGLPLLHIIPVHQRDADSRACGILSP